MNAMSTSNFVNLTTGTFKFTWILENLAFRTTIEAIILLLILTDLLTQIKIENNFTQELRE